MNIIKPSNHDFIFIGSGISCTAVLLQLLDKLENLQNVKPLNIAVIEKNTEFWKGIPYSSRSSVNSLTITNLGEFVPNVEKEQFIAWLVKNQDQWINELKDKGGATASKWLKNNLQAIESGQWDEIYIPRYLFGEYLRGKVDAEIGKAEKNNTAKVTYIQGLAVDINQVDHCNYQVKIKDNSGLDLWLQAEKVVLCIGSPPIKSIQALEGEGNYTYINDMYGPSLPHNFEIIKSVLSSVAAGKDRNVLILGSNASSLELLYLINTTPELKDYINKMIVFSRSGSLPNRINAEQSTNYEFENMVLLKNQKLFTSEDLMDAIENDISVARSKGINIADVYYQLSDLIVEMLEMLENTEKEKFHCFNGAEFSKVIRRAGAGYRDAATELERSGKLEMLKGSFLRLKNSPDKAGQVEYQVDDNKEGITFPLSFPLIINCGGFETLNSYSSSELISNLIVKKLCETNCTGRGFKVNERFEAADGLYVMGPLLGGIFNEKTRLWHVENAKSIFYLANLMVSEMTLGGINKMIIRNI